ncbi:exocyst complex component EXO84C isoform X2 [Malania oleifera]|uniref:exocyst complex component EXO84C isoform X2 n=1 Tax=Malania oleifera TaxID=397392 RepID=UPI0025ADEFCA|nr:exocyst complex component EXO84C isoform X2 [Malania oleifera]
MRLWHCSLWQCSLVYGIRKLCFELLDLKDAVENLHGNMRTKFLAFLRISEEVVEMEHELIQLQKHISSQRIIVQDLMSGACHELEEWNQANGETYEAQNDPDTCVLHDPLANITENDMTTILENIDVLLAEHRVEEALEALDAERSFLELKGSGDASLTEASSCKVAFMERKAMLEDQLLETAERPSVGILELKKALSGLIKLGKGPMAHQLLLKAYGLHLQNSIQAFLPSCSLCPRTYSATLSKLVFSMISFITKESDSMFGDNPVYTNRIVQWAEWEIESFVRLVKENAPSGETVTALRAASICIQASLSYCTLLEPQGLKLSKLLMVLLWPYIEEVLDLNFRRAGRVVLDLVANDESLPLSPRFASPLSAFATSADGVLIDSGMRFLSIMKDIVEQLTPLTILHFGGSILAKISQLFDRYVDALIKALSGPSEDDNLAELKEALPFRVETDSQQLALLGVVCIISDNLSPEFLCGFWSMQIGSEEASNGPSENSVPISSTILEYKEWKRRLLHSCDKLRDHFCRQYVLNFIYSGDGKPRLDARIYLNGKGENLSRDSDPLPSLPLQALFAKLQQLATVAGDVLLGREKIQKSLLARLTETVVMWLSDEQEFWSVLEDDSAPLQPLGLQQLILDMHFIVEIARFAGYPSRHVHQIASSINARAIRIFSARGIEPQCALLEDEWFVDTAKAAINKLLSETSGSETSETEEGHILVHDEIISDSAGSPSSLSTVESSESFASADMGELESPVYSDPEG